MSAWPPVCDRAWTDKNSLGPGKTLSSIASFRAYVATLNINAAFRLSLTIH